MTKLRVSNNHAISHINHAVRCLVLLALAFLSACKAELVAVAPALPLEIISTTSAPPERPERPEQPEQPEQKIVRYQLAPAPLGENLPRQQEAFPFRLLASGSENARVVDRNGNVVRSAPSGGTIFSIKPSPNEKWVLLYFGSAKYTIAPADTFEDMESLPRNPPIDDDVTGFRWFFLDDDHLFGYAQLRSIDTAGKMASEIDSLLPRATLNYVYEIESGALIPVEIDSTLPPVFSVDSVSDGQVKLLTLDDEWIGAKIVQAVVPED